MTILIIIIIVIIYAPIHICYNIYIRKGTGLSWWESYMECPSCKFKLRGNSFYKSDVLNEYYMHETKYGQPDLRYKDNPLCRDILYHYKCQACSHTFDVEETDYEDE